MFLVVAPHDDAGAPSKIRLASVLPLRIAESGRPSEQDRSGRRERSDGDALRDASGRPHEQGRGTGADGAGGKPAGKRPFSVRSDCGLRVRAEAARAARRAHLRWLSGRPMGCPAPQGASPPARQSTARRVTRSREELTTMLAREPRPSSRDPHPANDGGRPLDVLERSNEELTALIQHHQDVNLCIKRANRIRRAGPVVGDRVDRLPGPDDSLAEHLCRQLRLGRHDPKLQKLAEWIIWNLDPDGYLRSGLAPIAVPGTDIAQLSKALALVQTLEPTGVGARTLSECLLLQLHAQPNPDAIAVELVDGHLKALSEKRYDDLAHVLHCSTERIMQALAIIRRLEPRPGRQFGAPSAQTVRPEVTIERVGD